MFKNKKLQRAFSIFELLVVVTIIGILAAISAPIYTDYMIRAKVIKAMAVKDIMYKQISDFYSIYSKYPLPSELDVGVAFPAGSWANIWYNANGVGLIHYNSNWSGGAVYCLGILDLDGADGYSTPTSATDIGSGSAICEKVTASKKLLVKTCGHVPGSGGGEHVNVIKKKYLPKECHNMLS